MIGKGNLGPGGNLGGCLLTTKNHEAKAAAARARCNNISEKTLHSLLAVYNCMSSHVQKRTIETLDLK